MNSKHAELQWLLKYLKTPTKSVELIAKEQCIDLKESKELTDNTLDTQQKLGLRLYLLHLQAPHLLIEDSIKQFIAECEIEIKVIHDWLKTLTAPLSEYEAISQFLAPSSTLDQIQLLLFPRKLKSFGHIPPSRYRHEEDLKTTQRLEKKHSFSSLARWISEKLTEHAFEIRNNASAVRITEDQFPDLHQRYCSVCNRLGIQKPPPLYLTKGPVNAFTGGIEEPFLVIQEGMITQLTEKEQEFVLGHELGHVLFSHMLLHMIAQLSVIQGALFAPNILIGRILAHGLGMQVKSWSRYAELSCDRAGLLACQDLTAATHVLLRFAGVPSNKLSECNIEALLAQREVFQTRKEESLGFLFGGHERTHPWVVERLYELLDWTKSDDYAQIISEAKPLRENEELAEVDPELELLCLQAHLHQAHGRQIRLLRKQENRKIWILGSHPELSLVDSDLYDLDICNLTDEEASPADGFLILDSNHKASIDINEWRVKYASECFFYLNDTRSTETELPVSSRSSSKSSLFKWLREQDSITTEFDTHRQYWQAQINTEILRKAHKDASKKAIEHIEKEFEDLLDLSWFEELTPEERLFIGKERLIEQITLVTQGAAEEYKQSVLVAPFNLVSKDLNIKQRKNTPSPLEKITGIGTLAFGAFLLPSTPMWMILGAAGIGASSIATGEYLRKKSVNELLQDQLIEIKTWLEESKDLLCTHFKEQENYWISKIEPFEQS